MDRGFSDCADKNATTRLLRPGAVRQNPLLPAGCKIRVRHRSQSAFGPGMAFSVVKPLRCAVYTRKSTEHGLELEFNSLDAQREACEAYIKSQASLGWRCLAQRYDDPAYSGGNLERPALKILLRDIDRGAVDVVVVYKIDRLTRSLTDFAKLVEAFDKKSISFVAVTQQFNTTSSMGRLTLNVLLSFAQFERELSSERVRDKIAASRRKGKWTGGTVPLGYAIKNKKLVPHPTERETVRHIFERYVELKSLQKLVADLDIRRIVTKRRDTKLKKYQGGIPFTHGPLAYLLKNRVYLGEVHHGGNWYEGEQLPIVNRELFDQVQLMLKSNSVERVAQRTRSGALLIGKLFDDRGNVMSPSYSTKKGVRYRFYVSSALLRGRKAAAGSVGRVSAVAIEQTVTDYISKRFENETNNAESLRDLLARKLIRIELRKTCLRLTLQPANNGSIIEAPPDCDDIPWAMKPGAALPKIDTVAFDPTPNPQLVNAIVRAHAWVKLLNEGSYDSPEELARAHDLHPNFLRHAIRAAFLDPSITERVLRGTADKALLSKLRQTFGISWIEQDSELLGVGAP
jgi:DNA invertase Pin-like site-specific DNA recombinase